MSILERIEAARLTLETSPELETAVLKYEAADTKARNAYAVRAKGRESNENKAIRKAADIEKHEWGTVISEIRRAIQTMSDDADAVQNPETSPEDLATIEARYP